MRKAELRETETIFLVENWTLQNLGISEYFVYEVRSLSLVAKGVDLSRMSHSEQTSGEEAVGRSPAGFGKLAARTFARLQDDGRWRTIQ